MEDYADGVREIVENSARIKGDAFANALVAVYSTMLAADILAKMQVDAERSGVDLSALSATAAQLLSFSGAAHTAGMSEADTAELMKLAGSMLNNQRIARQASRAASASKANGVKS
jgi:hypothetical protein